MQISFIFCLGNTNLFLFFALGMQIFFTFSIDENDTILKTFLPFKCTKLTISFCNLYLPQKHPLALDFGWPKKVWKFSNFSISLVKYTRCMHTYKDCRAQSNFVVIINDLTQNMFTYSETHELRHPNLWDSPIWGTNFCWPIFIEVYNLPSFKGLLRFKEQFTADGEIPWIGFTVHKKLN